MAVVIGNGQVKKNDGSVITGKQGEWYDGQQFWNNTLSNPGQINQYSDQQGAGQMVSEEVVRQTNPNNVAYLRQQNPQAAPSYNNNAMMGEKGFLSGGVSANVPDINALYDKLMSSEEMKGLQKAVDDNEAEIQKRREAAAKAQSDINDNPFYAEATRVGKSEKLDQKSQRDIQNFEIAKANAINKLSEARELARERVNLSVTQHGLNREASNDALNKFNVLLQAGALDSASADDIAGLAGATGLSSGMIYSAVQMARKKNQNPQVIMDDNGNATIMDANTGEIINTVKGIGSVKKSGSGSDSLSKNDYISYLKEDASKGANLHQIFGIYSGFLEPDTILQIYNSSSKYGPAKENNEYLSKTFGVTSDY